jgi:hypothetical protein
MVKVPVNEAAGDGVFIEILGMTPTPAPVDCPPSRLTDPTPFDDTEVGLFVSVAPVLGGTVVAVRLDTTVLDWPMFDWPMFDWPPFDVLVKEPGPLVVVKVELDTAAETDTAK